MKLAFLILLLLNLALLAGQQGVFGRVGESGREPERVARQIEAERFRVLSEKEVQKLRERASQVKVVARIRRSVSNFVRLPLIGRIPWSTRAD